MIQVGVDGALKHREWRLKEGVRLRRGMQMRKMVLVLWLVEVETGKKQRMLAQKTNSSEVDHQTMMETILEW
jgi:hypothetical protein